MSLSSVRTRIYTTLSAAVVLGQALSAQAQVHDYFRSVRTEADILSLLTKSGTLHGWMVSLGREGAFTTTRSDRRPGRDPMQEFALYRFALYGWYGVKDSAGTEKVWADIVEDIVDAFRADKKLNNTVIDSGPLQWEAGGGGEGCVLMPPGPNASVLCHFAKLSLVVMEPLA